MTIFDIDTRITALTSQVDEETGEIPPEVWEELDKLMIERDIKIDNAACLYINTMAEAAAIREQEKILAERRRTLERRAEGIKNYVERATAGEPFTSARVQVKYRRSKAVEVGEQFWAKPDERFLRYKAPEANKDAIMKALKAGEDVPGAEIVERMSMSIPFTTRKKDEEENDG